jgi:hypothetical protein
MGWEVADYGLMRTPVVVQANFAPYSPAQIPPKSHGQSLRRNWLLHSNCSNWWVAPSITHVSGSVSQIEGGHVWEPQAALWPTAGKKETNLQVTLKGGVFKDANKLMLITSSDWKRQCWAGSCHGGQPDDERQRR